MQASEAPQGRADSTGGTWNMTAILQRRSFFDVMVGEPLELIKSQPHQVLLSTGSVALMGQFAGTDRIVDPAIGYLIAVGVEWAYLRGLASDSRAQTRWGGVLNWSAFGIVVLWGVLWVAGLLHAFDPTNGGWLLAAAHVVPVAWLSLCSAQCHRAAMAAEQREEKAEVERARVAAEKAEAARRAWELAQEEEDRKLARWKEAYTLKVELKATEKPISKNGTVPETKAKTAFCKLGNHEVAWSTPSEAGTIKRWGCEACRLAQKEHP